MNKLLWFIAFVIVGVFAFIVINNQGGPKTTQDLSPTQSPTETPANVSIEPSTAPTSKAASNDNVQIEVQKAVIKTSKGNIEMQLFGKDAPKTVKNFANKAQSGFYNNLSFHRVEDWVIQGGDPKGNGTGGGDMSVEFNNKPFVVGAVGVASRGDGKIQNDAQFFITKKDASWLNGQYTNFGQVTRGMDVVNKIAIGDKILEITIE